MPDIGANSSVDTEVSVVMEPNERIKQLSIAASNVPFDHSVPIKRYWRSGKELLRMANVYKEEQQLDKAFILYMKYITLFVEKIPQHSEYKNCDPNEKALTKTNCKTIFPIAEQLKSQLKDKFQKEYELYSEQKKQKQLEDQKRGEKEKQEVIQRREEEKERELRELQKKLDKKIEVKKERPELSVSNDIPKPIITTFNNVIANDSMPSIDRSTKPLFSYVNEKNSSLSRVIVPQKLIEKFLATAQRNTLSNIETCAMLAGRLGQNAFTITHVIVPKQRGTADSCQTENEEEVFLIQDDCDLFTIGWIHTHPTQSAFMSSIDLHTHCSYQLMLPEAIAIVCAPLKQEVGVYSLTSPYGLELIASCKLNGFHPHPTQPKIYEESSHISFDTTANVELIDLR